MINEFSCFSCVEYAKRCDVAFVRDVALPYTKSSKLSDIKDGCTVYCWSSMLIGLFEYLKTTNLKDIVLLSGDNDHSVNPNGCTTSFPAENYITAYIPCVPNNIRKWYAQNAQVVNDFMIPLPIGLSPPWVEGRVHGAAGIKQNEININRSELVYVNFGIATNPLQRTEIQNIISQNIPSNNTFGDQQQYYKDLQRFKYVICPPGNGKDSHRVWESIYFGAIPIVESSEMNRYFAKFFPILVVDRWCDITPEFLLQKYDMIQSKFRNKKLLDVDNWFKHQGILMHDQTNDLIQQRI